MCLSYEKPGEEGYRLKNNKNKVDRVERDSCNNKCGGEGQDSTGETGSRFYRALSVKSRDLLVLQKGNVILFKVLKVIHPWCCVEIDLEEKKHGRWSGDWMKGIYMCVCVCLLTNIGYCYN